MDPEVLWCAFLPQDLYRPKWWNKSRAASAGRLWWETAQHGPMAAPRPHLHPAARGQEEYPWPCCCVGVWHQVRNMCSSKSKNVILNLDNKWALLNLTFSVSGNVRCHWTTLYQGSPVYHLTVTKLFACWATVRHPQGGCCSRPDAGAWALCFSSMVGLLFTPFFFIWLASCIYELLDT